MAASCLYDNMKVVVTRYEDEQPIYNTRFLSFATHYGFRPWACRPRRPQTNNQDESYNHDQKTLEAKATDRPASGSDGANRPNPGPPEDLEDSADGRTEGLIQRGEQEHLSPLEFLERFLANPAQRRKERSIERRIRESEFPDEGASLESFDWNFNARWIDRTLAEELATGDFLRRKDPLVFVGQSGLGKSHLIQAVGRRLCALGYRVRYRTSARLLEDLHAAAGERTLPQRIRYYARQDLLIIDEFGFEGLERLEYPQAPSLLYKVIDSRSGKKSTALVTNIDFDDWGDYLGDPPLAMALLDRVVDGAIIHKFQGKSYRDFRAKQANARGKSEEKANGKSKENAGGKQSESPSV